MNYLLKLIQKILDLIFPLHENVQVLEKISPAEFAARVPRAEPKDEFSASDFYPLFRYRHPLMRTAIWQIKYRGNRDVAKLLAQLLYDEMIAELEDETIFGNFTKPLVLAVPLSLKRKRKRGFNQIELILDELRKIDLGRTMEFSKNILTKRRDTLPQTTMKDRRLRIMNLKGCFAVAKPELVRDRNIIVVDDVLTTGSTINESRQTLLKAGARKVICFTLAH
ncbi:MAG: hypothetical protein A3G52_03830 [Candidatus Taylorbacteria bacterium RIFCSPLOWO2_12_FULL_43_20]|uniref:Phosphoribosyltransferase domain-containing protein n=1 Tax=Candidatus Taylorbacteria bacterium RIFCSPLOWO2_12_FULL_43_20 TaxID=1802332 RepID=A0A1G2P1S2_9BACT|nr:MAG: hypothetical protein A3B98_01500 [Candidatus Taylorbacteria bacterium RIFCSPHIGHO2_02_FULL_43_55]OHA29366.1 MAG: hypothetical protein A3E92_02400 [Candidatus Taylorbacteria bacterium RIFCSPHIGHO2_12_FULL_42_34]OHA31742.1 MAG: hypothetical protein A3B09_01840 [Candidatus Taylorbacteria bacterium RIFCSPLOWO2_01_FULL_43_83]OHA38558.1 MAG: hypothetical protein A3H58_00130 [Candidatus Taylorbacteria bacterium RIFCSPLOWO2_02_FULL_43_22b]OHA42297.1 MAG: hypothetical protein A3G52_03830 [Candid